MFMLYKCCTGPYTCYTWGKIQGFFSLQNCTEIGSVISHIGVTCVIVWQKCEVMKSVRGLTIFSNLTGGQ